MKDKFNFKYLIFPLLLLFIFDVFLLKSNIDLRDKNEYYVSKDRTINEYDYFSTYYKNCFETSLQNDGYILQPIPLLDSLNNEISIRKIFKNKNKRILVCRFTSLNCKECIVYIQQMAKRMSEKLGVDNVVFFGFSSDNRQFNILRNQWGLNKMQVYNTLGLFDLPIENQSIPYFFVLSDSLQISSIFVPDRTMPKASEIYLNSINKKYFN